MKHIPGVNFTAKELSIFRSLNSPRKIQDFLDTLPMNFEPEGDTCLSPRRVLAEKRAHCIEAAMLAATALRLHGQAPLVMDFTAAPGDFDHVVTLFRQHGCWGAISKTNHSVLRYREPVYRSVRELAMSYFHEYFVADGKKTLRSYSAPVDLSRFDKRGWMTSDDDVWYVAEHLCEVKHFPILSRAQLASLRRADPIELEVVKITEWKK